MIGAVQVFLDVLLRKTMNQPLPATLEIVSYWWMPVIGLLALGLAEIRGEQIRMTLAFEAASPTTVKLADVGAGIVSIIVGLWITVLCAQQAFESFVKAESGVTVRWLPVWPARFAIVVALAVFLIAATVRVVVTIRESRSERADNDA
nr:TRAP transporter small permease subunit [Rhodococcus sp. 14C212]